MRNFFFNYCSSVSFLFLFVIVPVKVFSLDCTLPKPSNVVAVNISECATKLTWNAVPGTAYYSVKFKKQNSSVWSPVTNVGLNTSYIFSGLDSKVKYNFAVASYCSNNMGSGFQIVKATSADCVPPVITNITTVPPDAATITWNGGNCTSAFNQIRYRKSANANWKYVFTASSTMVTLHNLIAGALYTCQVTDCADTTGSWSSPSTFQLPARPNILMIILDDARYDSYSCNGGPAFFQSPNIDRIANEGVNFKYSFCVQSYCIPSRGSIVTGLYPHKHGATNNSENIYESLPTTAKILDSAGYYTGMIGKYHMAVKPQPGYDYWFATKVNSGTDEYNNLKYNLNGTLATVNGHDTDIVTDTTLAFLDRNADKSFFVTIGYHAPHNPFLPQSSYAGLYDGEEMPVPENTVHYKSNIPSFLYNLGDSYYIKPAEIPGQYQPYYEMMAGLDDAIGKILQKLTDLSILDNTIVIFTSDNGAMFGEHGLFLKRFAYDPSSRVPLFIRYPAWFNNETVIDDQLTLNVDLAPTLLDAAGINGGYTFDGMSLKKMADGTADRSSMYFESVYDPYTEKLPSLRSVRTFDAKYVAYGCTHETDEFFDLAADPQENTNQINNPLYAASIESFKSQLSDFKSQLVDTGNEKILNCYLKPGVQKSTQQETWDPEDLPFLEDNVLIYPAPAKESVTLAFLSSMEDEHAVIIIRNELGQIVLQESIMVNLNQNAFSLNVERLPAGFYMVTTSVKNNSIAKPLIIVD
ncbi:MAG: sulfatase-like hydrolase/transferase [Chitinophagaceae bacterium]|nr:sulfatase-like hydrolase/transferase [Chitinophagaceae bacterium]